MSQTALLASIQNHYAIQAETELFPCFVQLAALYIEAGNTQEGADVLAYLLARPETPAAIQEEAQALWDDLARWICPRVLYDAEDFGRKAELKDLVAYVLL